MGVISTKEILDRYYQSVSETPAERTRTYIDKPELYAYEAKIGKELIDMNADDLIGLYDELGNKRKGKKIKYMVSNYSYGQIATVLRCIFNFYINNIEVIKNPFNSDEMKSREVIKKLEKGKERFTWTTVEEIIQKLHKDIESDKAEYIELILLLFYNGFANAEEIIMLKENMINHKTRTVKLPRTMVRLSERCYELLVKFNKLETMEAWRGYYVFVSWHDSYFKFPVRESQVDKINTRTVASMRNIINHYISHNINDKYDLKINYRILYLLGCYDYIVGICGEEKVKSMINSYRNSDDVAELTRLAREYGIESENLTHFKRYLKPFTI